MSVVAFRIQNFMGFVDSGWIELLPICLVFGRNSVGKTALFKALRMLRQSLGSDPTQEPLVLSSEDGLDLGSYRDLVHGHNTDLNVELSFQCRIDPVLLHGFKVSTKRTAAREAGKPPISEEESQAIISLRFGLAHPSARQIILNAITISLPWQMEEKDQDTRVFYAEWQDDEYGWWIDLQLLQEFDPIWSGVENFHAETGFLPRLPGLDRGSADKHDEFDVIRNLLTEFERSIRAFLSSMVYLGPTRSEPQRFYYVPSSSMHSRGDRGTGSIQAYLASSQKSAWEEIQDQVNSCLADLDLDLSVHPDGLQSAGGVHGRLFEIQVEEADQPSVQINVSDVGFGVSQVMPIVLASVLAQEGAMVIIEQPELHLHPRAQAELGDLFIQAARSGVRYLIETHSEHLLMRIRRRIAETTAGVKDPKGERHQISEDSTRVYFVDRDHGKSTVQEIALDRLGGMEQLPINLRNFFMDSLEDAFHLTRAALETQAQGRASDEERRT